MQFTVPKFIEHEARIVGPLTFKQFVFIGIAGGISFVLYFVLNNLAYTIISAFILFGGASALAFVKIEGRSLPTIIKDFFVFTSGPKLYIWRKKGIPPKFLKKTEKEKLATKTKEESKLSVSSSKLNQLSTQIEIKTK